MRQLLIPYIVGIEAFSLHVDQSGVACLLDEVGVAVPLPSGVQCEALEYPTVQRRGRHQRVLPTEPSDGFAVPHANPMHAIDADRAIFDRLDVGTKRPWSVIYPSLTSGDSVLAGAVEDGRERAVLVISGQAGIDNAPMAGAGQRYVGESEGFFFGLAHGAHAILDFVRHTDVEDPLRGLAGVRDDE
jgi:hypothetical protein